MNIDELTIAQVREIASLAASIGVCKTATAAKHPAIGKYVIVRCRDAGVHAGVLTAAEGRSCSLKESRRLYYWKTKPNGSDFLSGIALNGLHEGSKVGGPVTIHLTENCEIIECSPESEKSIREAVSHGQ